MSVSEKVYSPNVGDKVYRMLGGIVPIETQIDAIDDQYIYCDQWKFDKQTGAEVNELLGWGNGRTGAFLKEVREQYTHEC